VEDVAEIVIVDGVEQLAEHREALSLPRDERILLAHGTQVDALAQVVHLGEVVTPALVDDLEHHLALDLAAVSLPPGSDAECSA